MTLYDLPAAVEEADFVAGLVRRIVGTIAVRDRDGSERPAEPRDVAVLYRSDASGEVLSGYRSALAAAGIPHVVPSRKGFFLRQEIQDLRIVLTAVDVPADLSARHAALKTVFFGLSDGEIAPLYGSGAVPGRTRDAVGLLSRLSGMRERASLADLLAALYRETGVDFVAARLPDGERIVQNLVKAAALARTFEWEGPGSLKLFLADIRRKTALVREEDEVPDFEEGENAVRLSTIHGAKGLEFPIVILGALSRGVRRGADGLRADRGRGMAAVIFRGFRTYSAFRDVPGASRPITFERWEREKIVAEERRLLYVAATRAKDRLYLVDGAKGTGSDLRDALREGIAAAVESGEGTCPVTGIPGIRIRFDEPASDGSPGGELLKVTVASPLPALGPPLRPPAQLAAIPAGPEVEPAPDSVPPEPVTLEEMHARERGKRFGEKVHRALEAFPPVSSPWPPAGAVPPVEWAEGEQARWEKIVAAIRTCAFHAELQAARIVGTELPLLRFRDGLAGEDRADLVVRREAAGGGVAEHWVVDYKTGERRRELEEKYSAQVREYMEILSEAWVTAVRGFIWYVESGESVELS